MKTIRRRKARFLRRRSLCPLCGQAAGRLYVDADTPKGACFSCKVNHADYDAWLIEQAEAAELAEPSTFGCLCGID